MGIVDDLRAALVGLPKPHPWSNAVVSPDIWLAITDLSKPSNQPPPPFALSIKEDPALPENSIIGLGPKGEIVLMIYKGMQVDLERAKAALGLPDLVPFSTGGASAEE